MIPKWLQAPLAGLVAVVGCVAAVILIVTFAPVEMVITTDALIMAAACIGAVGVLSAFVWHWTHRRPS